MRKRILKYLEMRGITRYKFYKETGLSNGYLDKEGDISASSYEKISYQYPDLNMDWVLTGNGDMLRDATPSAKDVMLASDAPQGIPVYDIDFACGFIEYSDCAIQPIGHYSIPPYDNPNRYCIIRATGDSMLPTIQDKAWVVIGRNSLAPHELIYGDIYALETYYDMRTIKRIVRSDDPDCLRLVPDNDAPMYGTYQDIPKESIRRCHRVFSSINITIF